MKCQGFSRSEKRVRGIKGLLSVSLTLVLISTMILSTGAVTIAPMGHFANGGFEDGLWSANGSFELETDPAYVHSGSNSAKIVNMNNDNFWATRHVVDFSGLNPQKTYAVTMWAKADDFVGKVYFKAADDQGGVSHVQPDIEWGNEVYLVGAKDADETLLNSGWVQYTTVIRSEARPEHFQLYASGTGDIWIDDIDLVEVEEGLVKNGSMEFGAVWPAIDGFDPTVSENNPAYVHSGSHSMKVTGGVTGYARGVVSVNVGTLDFANKQYYISLWAKANDYTGKVFFGATPIRHTADLYGWWGDIVMISGEGNRAALDQCPDITLTNTGWVKYVQPIKLTEVPNSDININLLVRGTGTIWIDDIEIFTDDTLIKNSGIEYKAWDGIDGMVTAHETIPAYVHSGGSSMKLVNPSVGYAGSSVSVNAAGLDFTNKTYYLSLWAKADSFTGHAYIQAPPLHHAEELNGWHGEIAMLGGGSKYDYTQITDVALINTGWVRYLQPIRLNGSAAANFDIRLFVRGTGTIWIDDVDIIEITDGVIKNGGMEASIWSNYNCTPQAEMNPSNVHSGAQSMKITANSGASNSEYVISGVSAKALAFDFEKTQYCISMWVKADTFTGIAYIQASPLWHAEEPNGWYGEIAMVGGGSKFKSDEITPVNLSGTGWVRYYQPVRLRRELNIESGFDIRLYVEGTGSIWVDDIELIEYRDILSEQYSYGDVDQKDGINAEDIVMVKKQILAMNSLTIEGRVLADVNKDGVVDVVDLVAIKKSILP